MKRREKKAKIKYLVLIELLFFSCLAKKNSNNNDIFIFFCYRLMKGIFGSIKYKATK